MKKFFRGRKRIAKKLYKKILGSPKVSKHFFDLLQFSISLKNGDVVGSSWGFNEIVDTVSCTFASTSRIDSPSAKVSAVTEILVFTKSGKILYADPYCNDVYRQFSNNEIVDYWQKWNNEEGMKFAKAWNMFDAIKTIERLQNGEKICDEKGLIL